MGGGVTQIMSSQGVSPSFPMGGYNILADRWYLHTFQWGGVPLSQVRTGEGGNPHHMSGQYGYPHPRSRRGSFQVRIEWYSLGVLPIQVRSQVSIGVGVPPAGTAYRVFATRSGWYASCVHAGGLSC